MPDTKTVFSSDDAELGEEELHGGQHRVVAAAGAPADLLVRLEVLPGEGDRLAVVPLVVVVAWPFVSVISRSAP